MRARALLLVVLVAACSGGGGEESQNTTATDVQEELSVAAEAADASAMKAPGIPASVAPNLAFEYRYAFKLPDNKIGAVQEEHAEACEVLGSARCQIVD